MSDATPTLPAAVAAPLAAALLVAWASVGRGLRDGPLRLPDALDSVALAALVVAVLFAVGARWPRLRRALSLTLLGSVVVLPCLHAPLLRWMGEALVGEWGDARWSLTPGALFGYEDIHLYTQHAHAWSCVIGLAASVPLCAALGRVRRARAVAGAVLGVVVSVVGANALATVTRPAPERWVEALPVLGRVPLDRVAPDPAQWFPHATPTPIAAGVYLHRQWRAADTPAWRREIVFAHAPPSARRSAGFLTGSDFLGCAQGSTLTLRAMPRDDRMLLLCERKPGGAPVDLIEVHHPYVRVYRFEALHLSAPPPAWVLSGACGLLLAAALLRRARSPVGTTRSDARHPYREPASVGPTEAFDERVVFLRATAIATAAHLSAPMVLLAWTCAAVR